MEWRTLVNVEEMPAFAFLGGKLGEEVDAAVKKKYSQNVIQNATSCRDKLVRGSNPFYVVAANEFLAERGLRVASPADLGTALLAGASFSGTYEDSGLVLRSNGEPNKYLANDLARQVTERNYKFSDNVSLMIPLVGLKLRVDEKSPSGLSFNLTDASEVIKAPQLSHENYQKRFSRMDEKGLPVFDDDGNRVNYTAQGGLHGFYLGRNEDLVSNNDNLEYSDDNGRVVVVRAGGAVPEILASRMSDLQAERDRQIAEVEKRYQVAAKVMRGEKI